MFCWVLLSSTQPTRSAIASEFKVSEPQKRLTIQTLNMDSPINITIEGAADKEEVAQSFEDAVFNRLSRSLVLRRRLKKSKQNGLDLCHN